MESLISLAKLLRIIRSLGFGAALGAFLFSIIYLASCILIPSPFDKDYFIAVLIIGALGGYGVQKIFVLINAPTKDQVLQKTIDSMWYNVDLGRIPESEASEITTQAFRQRLLSNQETQLPNILESEEKRQITPSQEEE